MISERCIRQSFYIRTRNFKAKTYGSLYSNDFAPSNFALLSLKIDISFEVSYKELKTSQISQVDQYFSKGEHFSRVNSNVKEQKCKSLR